MASKGHEIVVKANNYLSSLGFNNSTGKYDRIVHGVKGLLSSGFLEGADLDKAIKREVDRLLKKYNVTDNDTVGKMHYDPVMCMMVPDGKTIDELSLAQKKQVVTGLKGFLKKSYNFSDEREYSRAYEDLRHMFTTGSKKSISGLFENAVKKTGSMDGSIGNNVSDEKTIDKAIRSADGMFASSFGEYSKGAKFKKDKFLKELAGIRNAEEFVKRMPTLDNELKKNLERLDEAYNVASKDYYAARDEIRSIMDAFSREAFALYRKLDKK